jgi:hypothetical protein
MEKRDARTLKVEAQQELRNQIVRMKKLGVSAKNISKTTETSIEHISRIWSMYQKGGKKAILLKIKGLGVSRHVKNP